MERDLMLRHDVVQEATHQQKRVWRCGEKPIRTPRVTQNMTQSSQNKKFTRDAINTRMGDRELLVQAGGNPFLSNNNYVKDMAIRDQYLLSRDSNFN